MDRKLTNASCRLFPRIYRSRHVKSQCVLGQSVLEKILSGRREYRDSATRKILSAKDRAEDFAY